jgi:hypothetical protein
LKWTAFVSKTNKNTAVVTALHPSANPPRLRGCIGTERVQAQDLLHHCSCVGQKKTRKYGDDDFNDDLWHFVMNARE